MMGFLNKAPVNHRGRLSSDSVWPLRRANGQTWAEAQKKKGHKMIDNIESKIATQIVDDVLAAGYGITVQDGEEITVRNSSNREEILGALQTTAEDMLYIHAGFRTHWVRLIWGNDIDVISDYSGPDEVMIPLLESAQNIADAHQA